MIRFHLFERAPGEPRGRLLLAALLLTLAGFALAACALSHEPEPAGFVYGPGDFVITGAR